LEVAGRFGDALCDVTMGLLLTGRGSPEVAQVIMVAPAVRSQYLCRP
jgi:hypothetical protein